MNHEKAPDSLDSALRDGALYHRAPPGLRARVRASLPRESPRLFAFAWDSLATAGAQTWFRGALAGIALGVLATSAAVWTRPAPADPLAQEIVASHVRALLSQHAIDVASSDQHTVKPWFNGRLDYAPPVLDLAPQGFPLVGGRVDYVGHRSVAVLVYRYRKHPIDLYVFPDAGGAAAPAARSADGYSVARWHRAGMAYWAITDADASHLRAFEQAQEAAAGHEDSPPPE